MFTLQRMITLLPIKSWKTLSVTRRVNATAFGVLFMTFAQSANAIEKSRYTIKFHGGGTTHLRTLDNHPGAWHYKSNSTFVIGGDSNHGVSESIRVSKIQGRSRQRPAITTQYVGGSRRSRQCVDNKVPADYNNPEKMARGALTRQNQLCAKSYGITSIYSEHSKKEELWAWFSPGNGPTGYRSSTLMFSIDEGKSWRKSYTMYTAQKKVFHPSFMSAGPGYTKTGLPPTILSGNNGRLRAVRDYWVYMTMAAYDPQNASKLSMQGGNGRSGKIYLCRQSRNNLNSAKVRCYVGGQKRWITNDLSRPGTFRAKPILASSRGISWAGASLSYIPRNKKYLMITEHTNTMSGKLQFLEANKPWGPYRMVLSTNDFQRCTGAGGSKAFFARHDPRWSHLYKKDNPARLQDREVMVFTGVLNDDAMKTILFSLERRQSGATC